MALDRKQLNNFKRAQRMRELKRLELVKQKSLPTMHATRLANRVTAYNDYWMQPLMASVRPIYCSKSGSLIGMLAAQGEDLTDATHLTLAIRERWENQQIAPAWFDTTAERLRTLQLLDPHGAVVYYSCLFERRNLSARERYKLNCTLHTLELSTVVELAELLRRCLAIMGKHDKIVATAPTMPDLTETTTFTQGPGAIGTLIEYKQALHNWFCEITLFVQRKIHADDLESIKIVTLGAAETMAESCGLAQFRAAGVDTENDAVFLELAELFSDVDFTQFSYTRPKSLPKIPKPKAVNNVSQVLPATLAWEKLKNLLPRPQITNSVSGIPTPPTVTVKAKPALPRLNLTFPR